MTIISVHIAKTAGSSLFHILEAHFGQGFQPDYALTPPSRRLRLARISTLLAPSIKCLHGHFKASKYDIGKRIIFLRDPYSRAVSHFWYGVRERAAGTEHFKDKDFYDLPLAEYLKRKDETYETWIDIPPGKFHFVGSSDHFEQDLDRLCRDVLGKKHEVLNRNLNPNGRDYENADLREIYEKANPHAIEIYRAMMAERAKQLI